MGQRRLKQVQRSQPQEEQAGAGAVLQPMGAHGPHPQAACKKSKFSKYGLQPASGNHIPSGGGTPGPASPCDPRTQSHPTGSPPAPALVTTGSASRVSHRKIPLQPSQRGRGADGGDCPSEAPHLSGGQPREGWQRGLGQALPASAGCSKKLGGSAEGKVGWGRGKAGEGLPGPRRATGASCTQGGQPPPPWRVLTEQSRPTTAATV